MKKPHLKKTLLYVRAVLFLLLGLFCALYFIICVLYAGFGLSWLFIWPLFSIFSFVRFYMLCRHLTGRTKWNCPNIIRILYYLCFSLFLIAFVVVESKVVGSMRERPEPELPYVIVLGAGVRGDVPTRPLLLRMQRAAEYLKENPDTCVIASGGQGAGENISEAECIKNYLIAEGIEAQRIIMEDCSKNTEENLQNSFTLIPRGTSKVGILSNGFHLYRAKKIAAKQGHDNVLGIPSRTLLPVGIHYTVREFFAVVKLMLFG